MKNGRDIIWCWYVNEPTFLRFGARNDDWHCDLCEQTNPHDEEWLNHTFMQHVFKPGGQVMRRFILRCNTDVSGISGVGDVADGVEFGDGSVAIRWRGETPSTVIWESTAHAVKVHGHGGATELVWLDV